MMAAVDIGPSTRLLLHDAVGVCEGKTQSERVRAPTNTDDVSILTHY